MVHRTRPNAAALEDSGEQRLLRFCRRSQASGHRWL